jgi:hypothetical protein
MRPEEKEIKGGCFPADGSSSKHENGPSVRVRVKVRRPVWVKGKGYGQRFKAK